MVKSFYQILMTKDSRNLVWILGEGGLLGSALSRQADAHLDTFRLWHHAVSLNWTDPQKLQAQFRSLISTFRKELAPTQSWTLLWAAGAGIIGSTDHDLRRETASFTQFLAELEFQFGSKMNEGHIFLGSSAGGLWGGASVFPVSEQSPTSPISEYGRQKSIQESEVLKLAERYPGLRILIGRISNLYGTRQKLGKPQGLLSQLCRSTLLHVPLNIFVSLDTVRDYIFDEDCAELIYRALKHQQTEEAKFNCVVKIFASEEPTSIRLILKYLHRLTKREPIIIFPTLQITSQQPIELSFTSHTFRKPYAHKPLIEGLKLILSYQETLLQRGELPFPEANL